MKLKLTSLLERFLTVAICVLLLGNGTFLKDHWSYEEPTEITEKSKDHKEEEKKERKQNEFDLDHLTQSQSHSGLIRYAKYHRLIVRSLCHLEILTPPPEHAV